MIKNIIVHHAGGTDANPMQDSSGYTLAQCNSDHKARFGMKSSLGYWVGYHYFIDKAGKVTQTRKDAEEGAHCVGYNNTAYDKYNHPDRLSIGICLAGNFDATRPTAAQTDALVSLMQAKVREYGIDPKNIVPHRAHAKKSCYGNLLPESWARSLLESHSAVLQPPLVTKETWQDKFNRLMLATGLFEIRDGKWVSKLR